MAVVLVYVADTSFVDVVTSTAIVVEVGAVGGVPMQQRYGLTGYSRRGGVAGVDGSSTAGSGGGGKEAWFQAAAASVDVSDIDSARTLTTAWKRLNACCTQLRHLDCLICIVTDGYNALV